jgi:hypothetical protein
MEDLRNALQPLVRHPSSPPPPLEHIRARAVRRRLRRRAFGGAAVVATVVAVGIPVWTLVQPDEPRQLVTASAGQESTEPPPPNHAEATVPEGVDEMTPLPGEPGELTELPDDLPSPAPSSLTLDPTPSWSGAPLPAADAPAFVEAWNRDPYARECPALAPDDLGEGAGATPRVTDRGLPGAWWVEYDLAGAPGEVDIQSPAADAGRANFFVSATIGEPGYELPVSEESINSWPNVHHWSDGSSVGWGVAGRGVLQQAAPEWPTHWLAYMELEGSRCFYQVGSYLSEEHLIFLLSHLRFVESAP